MLPTDSIVPEHVAVIMDGNGRWARERGMARHSGHQAGVKSVRATVKHAALRGIQHLTLFAFSSENWSRPAAEVGALMALFVEALRREVTELHRNNVRLEFVGNRASLGAALIRKIEASEARTADNDGLHLIIAIAYGGRWDIVGAARKLAKRAVDGDIHVDDIDEQMLGKDMQFAGVPDPDLLIRTGGEQRISNFLLWNLAYAELWFCDTLWPDFDEAEFDRALDFFARRQRRFGQTGDQQEAAEC
ncbi:MAG: di-trans,poly-cis-decaprenylcistransferase [Gammaproteobacteria bacterium]|nr:MAG: di-trans,poly-cis-decaprenylcistransferase [Gammaproteobacteria bacterium]